MRHHTKYSTLVINKGNTQSKLLKLLQHAVSLRFGQEFYFESLLKIFDKSHKLAYFIEQEHYFSVNVSMVLFFFIKINVLREQSMIFFDKKKDDFIHKTIQKTKLLNHFIGLVLRSLRSLAARCQWREVLRTKRAGETKRRRNCLCCIWVN